MKRLHIATLVAGAMLAVATPAVGKAPTTWDGLVQVKSKRLDLVYLQPGADFRAYTKVLLEPTEVSFAKNWQRDYNRSTASLSSRISDSDVQEAVEAGVKESGNLFADALTKGGYQIVTQPGPDVLRVKTGVVNISVNAPDKMNAARSYSFSEEAGRATLFVEARDSQTGALLGRAVDQRIVGDSGPYMRSSVSNRGDFRDQVARWAEISARGLTELKSLSPITP